MLRRGRLIVFGDVSEHVYVYTQVDFSGSTGAPDQSLQARDFYADIAFDDEREFRVRPGISKVPFGWVNMQSSQNRGPMERPDALNSTVEGERDYGLFFFWAPKEIRELMRDLVRSGRKGSGDYGVVSFGPYAGQGLNRSDRNGEMHWVGRVSYPFQLSNDQVLELGVMGHYGRFVPSVQPISGTTPTFEEDGVVDQRVGVTAVWYPRPFGLEAEWNWGEGPQLSETESSIVSEYLHGGYVQAGYRVEQGDSAWYPFTRWHYYDGGRKFGTNAPPDEVNELDIGLEYSPVPAVELTLMFTQSFWRTNTSQYPYERTEDAQRLGLQLQFNF
jgi:hypothetical protein